MQLASGLRCVLESAAAAAPGSSAPGGSCVVQLCADHMNRAVTCLFVLGPVLLGALALLGLCGAPGAAARSLKRLVRGVSRACALMRSRAGRRTRT
jgi:hypothetical protein